jgi:hypothetical protein
MRIDDSSSPLEFLGVEPVEATREDGERDFKGQVRYSPYLVFLALENGTTCILVLDFPPYDRYDSSDGPATRSFFANKGVADKTMMTIRGVPGTYMGKPAIFM